MGMFKRAGWGIDEERGLDSAVVRIRQCATAPFHERDGGFTQVGVVIAILLVASLMFVSAQNYWISSNAADIQFAADAGALAADNVIAEYMVTARVADALVLSMGLLGLSLFGVSIVTACIPFTEEASIPIANAAERILTARSDFSKAATKALDSLQKVLPFLCALNAATTISANGNLTAAGGSYLGIAIPVPLTGEDTDVSDDDTTDESKGTIKDNDESVEDNADKVQEAADAMDAAKLTGYLADCGDESGSMMERASRLAGLEGTSNPRYSSVDTWGFGVAIRRAESYYNQRLASEAPQDGSVDALANSIARRRFYTYALDEVKTGYETVDADGTKHVFMPVLARNTEDAKGTMLYTESVYPVSTVDGKRVLHCSAACPGCASVEGTAALCDIDSGAVALCPVCQYSIATVGATPRASTSIDNGFEYYYRTVALAAARYAEAADDYNEAKRDATEKTQDSLDAFKKALESFAVQRYDPLPPGRYGCIAIVIDGAKHAASASLSAFTGASAMIGPRMALSAACLAPEEADYDNNVISSLLSGIQGDIAGQSGVGPIGLIFMSDVVGLWGDVLLAYSKGTEGLISGISSLLDRIPGIGSSLSSWARNALEDVLELTGLQPMKMDSLKPVVINTSHVLSYDTTGLSTGITGLRGAYTGLPGDGNFDGMADVLDTLADIATGTIEEKLSGSFTIATIQLSDALPGYEVKVTLPDQLIEASTGIIGRIRASFQFLDGITWGEGRWE